MTGSDEEIRLDVFHIELADTRPTMIPAPILGEIPFVAGAAIFVVAGYCMILFGFLYMLWAPAVWWLVGKRISKDYHAITKFMRWLYTSAWTSNKSAMDHGGASAAPMQIVSERQKGMASNAF